MGASTYSGPIDRLGLFGYRTGVLESEVIKPLVLCLLDPEESAIPDDQLAKALDVVESWMVRRMLVRAATKSYSQVIAELVAQVRKGNRSHAGDVVEAFFANQSSESRYWPDDAEVRDELSTLLAYRRLRRGRLRMVLESIEDFQRGWRNARPGLGEERVARGKLVIEHIMPRKWVSHWPLPDGTSEPEREQLLHTLGNLTLLTGKLNSKVSNGPWLGMGGKREALEAHDVLLLNREFLKKAGDSWTEEGIRTRTREMTECILQIWPVPRNHRSNFQRNQRPRLRKFVQLADLISGGALTPGMTLFPRRKKFSDGVAILLADGRIEVDERVFNKPSEAAAAITGHATAGWGFFLVDQASRRSLRDVRRDYIEALAVDDEPDDEGSEDDD